MSAGLCCTARAPCRLCEAQGPLCHWHDCVWQAGRQPRHPKEQSTGGRSRLQRPQGTPADGVLKGAKGLGKVWRGACPSLMQGVTMPPTWVLCDSWGIHHVLLGAGIGAAAW